MLLSYSLLSYQFLITTLFLLAPTLATNGKIDVDFRFQSSYSSLTSCLHTCLGGHTNTATDYYSLVSESSCSTKDCFCSESQKTINKDLLERCMKYSFTSLCLPNFNTDLNNGLVFVAEYCGYTPLSVPVTAVTSVSTGAPIPTYSFITSITRTSTTKPSTTRSSTTTDISTPQSPKEIQSEGKSNAERIGLPVGIVVAVVVIACLLWCCCCTGKTERTATVEPVYIRAWRVVT